MTLQEAVEILSKKQKATDNVFYGLVEKVDKAKLTCEVSPLNGDAPVLDVRLSADTAKNGFVIFPKIKSAVAVVMESETGGFIAMVSEIDKFTFKTDEEDLKKLLEDLLTAIKAMTFSNGGGLTGFTNNSTTFTALETRLNKFFE